MARVHFDRVGTPRWTSLLALFVTLLPIVLLQACARPSAQPADPPPPKVTTAEVLSREVTEFDEFTGRLEAVNTVAVRPRVSGYVSSEIGRASCREGVLV